MAILLVRGGTPWTAVSNILCVWSSVEGHAAFGFVHELHVDQGRRVQRYT